MSNFGFFYFQQEKLLFLYREKFLNLRKFQEHL